MTKQLNIDAFSNPATDLAGDLVRILKPILPKDRIIPRADLIAAAALCPGANVIGEYQLLQGITIALHNLEAYSTGFDVKHDKETIRSFDTRTIFQALTMVSAAATIAEKAGKRLNAHVLDYEGQPAPAFLVELKPIPVENLVKTEGFFDLRLAIVTEVEETKIAELEPILAIDVRDEIRSGLVGSAYLMRAFEFYSPQYVYSVSLPLHLPNE